MNELILDHLLKLPEERTEAEQELFMRTFMATTQAEVRESSPGVWQYTFTPLPMSPMSWAESDPFFDNPRANCALARMGQQEASQHRREVQARKRERRQHRATYRRRKRGLA